MTKLFDDAAPQIRFTPTQQRMAQLLADGELHTMEELKRCLWDELSEATTVRHHLSGTRKVLRLMRQDIICELDSTGKSVGYRRVQYLDQATVNGKNGH